MKSGSAPGGHPSGRQGPSPLRAVGLRATPQREAILQILDGADRPLSAEEIRSRMREPRSGVPTIYRNLHQFAMQGWVEPVPCRDNTLRFVRCRSTQHHHHIQCERCGRVVEVGGCALAGTLDGMAERSGFRITRHQLLLSGLCPACQVQR